MCARDCERQLFAKRRASFAKAMAEAGAGEAVAILPAAPVFSRNGDVEHDYRQDSDLFYMTGFDEPQSVLVFGASDAKSTLFVRPRDPDARLGRSAHRRGWCEGELWRRRVARHPRARGEAPEAPPEQAAPLLPPRPRPRVRRRGPPRDRPHPRPRPARRLVARRKSSTRARSSTRCASSRTPRTSRR